ncbi:hypothetical protein C4J97_3712 [Pseudomonas orientalis]|nr:hypothetical protein C4J97_3712 [Pseudomonas orientalis]
MRFWLFLLVVLAGFGESMGAQAVYLLCADQLWEGACSRWHWVSQKSIY